MTGRDDGQVSPCPGTWAGAARGCSGELNRIARGGKDGEGLRGGGGGGKGSFEKAPPSPRPPTTSPPPSLPGAWGWASSATGVRGAGGAPPRTGLRPGGVVPEGREPPARGQRGHPAAPAPGAARARSGGWFQPPCTFARVDRRSEAAESWGWLGARTTANEAQLLASWLLERHSLLRSLSLHRHHPVHPQRLQLRPGITFLPFSWKQTKTRVTPHTRHFTVTRPLTV